MDPHAEKKDRIDDANHTTHSSRTASVRRSLNDPVASNEKIENTHNEKLQDQPVKIHDKLRNPLSGISKEQLMRDVKSFAQEKGLMDALPDLRKGALLAQAPERFEMLDELTEEDKESIRQEVTHRWRQPKTLYYMTGDSPARIFAACTEVIASSLRRLCNSAGYGSNSCQWSTRILLRRVWDWRRSSLAERPVEWSTISLLCFDRLLDHETVKQLVWKKRMHLHLLLHKFCFEFLDG